MSAEHDQPAQVIRQWPAARAPGDHARLFQHLHCGVFEQQSQQESFTTLKAFLTPVLLLPLSAGLVGYYISSFLSVTLLLQAS